MLFTMIQSCITIEIEVENFPKIAATIYRIINNEDCIYNIKLLNSDIMIIEIETENFDIIAAINDLTMKTGTYGTESFK